MSSDLLVIERAPVGSQCVLVVQPQGGTHSRRTGAVRVTGFQRRPTGIQQPTLNLDAIEWSQRGACLLGPRCHDPIDQPHLHSVVKLSLLKLHEVNHDRRQLLQFCTFVAEIDTPELTSPAAEVKVNDKDGGLQLFHGFILTGRRPLVRMSRERPTFLAFRDAVRIGHNWAMRRAEALIVDGLEVACRQTCYLEWVPGWNRIYHCQLAKWSNQLDQRWATGRWPIHAAPGVEGWDEWEQWHESLSDEERVGGHWHVFG